MFHMQLTFLKPEWQTKYQDEQSVYFPLTMLLVIRSMQQMRSHCARKMPKGPSKTWGQSPRMWPGTLPGGARQEFYYPENHPDMPGWFKGMQQILEERGLFHTGLLAQCPGFKC